MGHGSTPCFHKDRPHPSNPLNVNGNTGPPVPGPSDKDGWSTSPINRQARVGLFSGYEGISDGDLGCRSIWWSVIPSDATTSPLSICTNRTEMGTFREWLGGTSGSVGVPATGLHPCSRITISCYLPCTGLPSPKQLQLRWMLFCTIQTLEMSTFGFILPHRFPRLRGEGYRSNS